MKVGYLVRFVRDIREEYGRELGTELFRVVFEEIQRGIVMVGKEERFGEYRK